MFRCAFSSTRRLTCFISRAIPWYASWLMSARRRTLPPSRRRRSPWAPRSLFAKTCRRRCVAGGLSRREGHVTMAQHWFLMLRVRHTVRGAASLPRHPVQRNLRRPLSPGHFACPTCHSPGSGPRCRGCQLRLPEPWLHWKRVSKPASACLLVPSN